MQMQPVEAHENTEALIVGGGPAGLAAAIALGQRGIACTVVEARTLPIDKACGEGLMPDSRETLAQLGISLTESDGQPFRGIRFQNSTHRVDGHFPHGTGLGVRRPHLHALLAARAAATGARLLSNSHIQLPSDTGPAADGTRTALVNGQPMRFRNQGRERTGRRRHRRDSLPGAGFAGLLELGRPHL